MKEICLCSEDEWGVNMAKWKCLVCGYVHEGELPPEECIICGVGKEEFVLVEEKGKEVSAGGQKKHWKCVVCDYIHTGETPPDSCPICGVGPDQFVLLAEEVQPDSTGQGKRWKCVVCDYIHTGETPPDSCPICGVGPDQFVLLEESGGILTEEILRSADVATAHGALEQISYGLYVVTSLGNQQINGQCANTVFQLTSKPPQVAVCLQKRNLTHDYIMESGVFAVSMLSCEQGEMVTCFGHQTGRKVDKFQKVSYINGKNGCPILRDCIAYLECTVEPEKTVDVGTHTLFVGAVTSGRVVTGREAMTYACYKRSQG